ncbi:S-adenosyl-L-methionine-dependent methyltransferase [Lenzites betulinus]|nr:S-adenosyl-L-methionine-dependent methyltransferase [Lenzites betulinus]
MAIELVSAEAPYSDSDPDGAFAYLVPVDNDEIPTYFLARGARLFARNPDVPYPLPVDPREQFRQNDLHDVIRGLTWNRCAEWLLHALENHPNERRRVLDVGTGTGAWMLEMAEHFPHVLFTGIDIVPISTRSPPANVILQLYDVTLGLPHASSSFDIIHARMITLGVRDYLAFVNEAARVLRPGGLLSICEWTRSIGISGQIDVALRAPRACAFLIVLDNALRSTLNYPPTAFDMARCVANQEELRTLQSSVISVPVGDWHEDQNMKALGVKYRDVLVAYAHSMRTFLEGFHAADDVDGLIDGFIADLHGQNSLVSAYYVNHAERI